jgi:DNA polymerase-3 subunit alpha
MTTWFPTHVHTTYSLLDGEASALDYAKRAKELGLPGFAVCDHGTTSGWREAQRAAKETGLKIALGMEGYIVEDRFDKRSKASRQDGTELFNHITMIATDEIGYETLSAYSRKAWTEGYYYKPRGDIEMLREHNEGLIVYSGCMSGMIPKRLIAGDYEGAKRLALEFKEIFGDRFYMEVMGPNDPALNMALLALADELKIKPIATADCHYSSPEQLEVEEALLILNTSPKKRFDIDQDAMKTMDLLERFNYLYPDRKMTFQEIEIYMRGYEDERSRFLKQGIERTDIFENTLEVLDRIGEYPYYEGLDLLPRPKNVDENELLRQMTYEGLRARGFADNEVYIERVEHELAIIKKLGFAVYFLILADALNWARQQGIFIGPGRGSSGASLVLYCINVTEIDPIPSGLLFMRFLDESRPDWPDADIDVPDDRRQEIREYIASKYGHVAGIATIIRFHGKSSIRDAARVLQVPLGKVNRALKDNDASDELNKSIDYYDWFITTPKGKEFHKEYPQVVPLAKRFYGKVKTFGQHPAGLVVSKEPIDKFAPIETAKIAGDRTGKAERGEIAAIDKDEAANIGLIKYDFLGLKTLRIISTALDLIKQTTGETVDIRSVPKDDPKVYEMISDLRTRGIFQLSEPAYTRLVKNMGGIQNFEELVASNALVRPGAMNTIGPEYMLRKEGKVPVTYVHDCVKPFTSDTYGLPTLFQEQVMLMMTELAGMTMTEANKVRKITAAKKDKKLLQEYRERFIEGASQKITRQQAEKLWGDVEAQAEYSFNKIHSVAYSTLSYWTAWLKVHYPKEFLTACLKAADNAAEATDFMIEMKRMGIQIKLPHINHSGIDTEIQGEDVRLGLTSIKYVGKAAAKAIIAKRPFTSYADLQEKAAEKYSGINAKAIEYMNKVGACAFEDNLPTGRESENFYEVLGIPKFEVDPLPPQAESKLVTIMEWPEEGIGFLRAILRKVEKKNGWARANLLDETGDTGLFCNPNTHPESGSMYLVLAVDNRAFSFIDLQDINQESPIFRYLMDDLPEMEEGEYYTVAWRNHKTKQGKDMAYMVAADHLGQLHHIIVFSRMLPPSKVVAAPGRVWSGEVKEKIDEQYGVSLILNKLGKK